MQKFFTLLSLLAFLLPLNAQEDYDAWMRSEGSLEGFTVGSQWYTFVTDANLRSAPGTTSAVVTKLPIGARVTVESVSSDSLTLRGVRLPWLQVSAQVGGVKQKGYIWGGFMALASIQTPAEEGTPNAGVLYLTGVSAYEPNKHQITVQVRAAKDNKELSKTEFTTSGDLSYYPSFALSFEPLKNVKAVLTVNYYYPACGYPSGNNLIFWLNNGTMGKVLETSSVSEGGVFYSSEECIMPSQPGGIGDHLIVTYDMSQFEEKGTDLVRAKQEYKISLYKWNGVKLLKTKEMK